MAAAQMCLIERVDLLLYTYLHRSIQIGDEREGGRGTVHNFKIKVNC